MTEREIEMMLALKGARIAAGNLRVTVGARDPREALGGLCCKQWRGNARGARGEMTRDDEREGCRVWVDFSWREVVGVGEEVGSPGLLWDWPDGTMVFPTPTSKNSQAVLVSSALRHEISDTIRSEHLLDWLQKS
jgi:hypothetical protein